MPQVDLDARIDGAGACREHVDAERSLIIRGENRFDGLTLQLKVAVVPPGAPFLDRGEELGLRGADV